jgi:TorA maturation chaperone TorD
MNNSELLTTLESRRLSYVFLSQVYAREVSLDFLRKLRDAPQETDEMLKEFAERLKGSDLEEVKIELAAEYAGLFLSAGRHPVFPFESVYTSEERLLMQEARDEVLSEYRKEGLDKIEGFREPEDHISIELEFMSYLCQKTIDLIKNGDDEAALAYLKKQKDFLEKHLMVWVPIFCIDLEQATKSDFYGVIAKLTKSYIELEKEILEENLI